MNLLALLGWAELVVLGVVVAIGIGCWLVFSRSSNEKKDQWRPTEARSLSESVEFPNESAAWGRNEFKDFVRLSAL